MTWYYTYLPQGPQCCFDFFLKHVVLTSVILTNDCSLLEYNLTIE